MTEPLTSVMFAQVDARWDAIVDDLIIASSSTFGETVRQADVWASNRGLVFVCNGLELDVIRNPATQETAP